jgi:predicted small lipoprotein YifL
MRPLRRRHTGRAATLTALLVAAVGGCGQTGPLMLPGAEPVEQPAPSPPPDETEAQDDEPENER